MKKAAVGLATLATVALAGAAQGQLCAGYPSSDGGMYFGARMDFPEGGDSWGVEAAYNASGALGVYGGLNVLSDDSDTEDEDDLNQYVVGISFETPSIGLMIGPRVSACPVVEGRFISEEGVSIQQFPIGLGLGVDLGLPVGPQIGAYVQPQLVISRIDIDDLGDDTETNFGVNAGAAVGLGLITVGGEVRHIFEDGADPVIAIRAGIRL